MDELARYNKERWEELAQTGIEYARPFLDLEPTRARQIVDDVGLLGNLVNKDVLCLASGGGQQSAAFVVLGANVTVLDLSETQLQRDQQAAQHYGLPIHTQQGDMRDLTRFAAASFDVIWQAYSINFVPDPRPVFDGVARLLRPGGFYRLGFHNPFTQAVDDAKWNGIGYPLNQPYLDGAEILEEQIFNNPNWEVTDPNGVVHHIRGPRAFRHTLSTLLNGLSQRNFVLLNFQEETSQEPNPEPGSWEHYKSVVAPFLNLWAVLHS